MNAAEKFNHAIEAIEEYASAGDLRASDIAQKVASEYGFVARDMSTIFGFLTERKLNAYITERKLTAAYRYLATSEEKSKVTATGIAGYGDQPAFTRAFKKLFGITPGEAQRKRDLTDLNPPITWEQLFGSFTSENTISEGNIMEQITGILTSEAPISEEPKEPQVFGISESAFERIEKVLDLQAFYGFSKMFSQYAFDLANQTGHTLDDCFRYADSLRDYGGDFDDDYDDHLTPADRLNRCGEDETTQFLFFERGISVNMSRTLLYEHFVPEETLRKCDPEALRYFPGFEEGVNISFDYYLKAFNYYKRHFMVDGTEDSFNEYLDYICAGYPIEEAFEIIYGSAAFEEELNETGGPDPWDSLNEDLEDLERYSTIEAEAAEEERWHGERIDDDLYYDPENDYYGYYLDPSTDDEENYDTFW